MSKRTANRNGPTNNRGRGRYRMNRYERYQEERLGVNEAIARGETNLSTSNAIRIMRQYRVTKAVFGTANKLMTALVRARRT